MGIKIDKGETYVEVRDIKKDVLEISKDGNEYYIYTYCDFHHPDPEYIASPKITKEQLIQLSKDILELIKQS